MTRDTFVDTLARGMTVAAALSVAAAINCYTSGVDDDRQDESDEDTEIDVRDEVPQPPRQDPAVLCGHTLSGHYVFLDVENGLENARPAMMSDAIVDVEANR